MNEAVYKDALELHRAHGGKIEITSKVPLATKEDLSLAYTPGVAEICREIAKDSEKAKILTLKKNTVAIISDGSAILGLGNLGAEAAIPVMEGKAALFKHFANIDGFPICITTQDVDEIVETVKRIAPVFGGINLEDISAPRCFEIESRLRGELRIPVMHDDQHGTATVVLAGLMNALKVTGLKKEAVKIVVNGAGAAGLAVTNMLLGYGLKNITVCDSKGAISSMRTDLTDEKMMIAQKTNLTNKAGSLQDVIKGADVFLGVSKAGLLTKEMVRSMNSDPIIFALANPTPEIMPEDAKEAGARIIATGRSDFPNQVNNALAFPGMFRGALDNNIKQFKDYMFFKAAENLAACIESPSENKILPTIFDEHVVLSVSKAIIEA